MTLTLRTRTAIPLELDGVTPPRVAGLSAADVAKLPVQHGNRSEPLGEFFSVAVGGRADLHFAGDTGNVKGVAAGMAGGSVFVEDDAGMHAGAGMTGGTLVIGGAAGDWLGAEMRGGGIEVRGNAGHLVGAAYRGSRRGMTGGTILVRGNVGDEAGLLMRRGIIAVCGATGAFAAASMIAGTLVAGRGFGPRAGAGMKRGTLLTAGGEPDLPPGFALSCEYRPQFLGVLLGELRRLGWGDVSPFDRPAVRCYRGDLIHGGNGEVLVA